MSQATKTITFIIIVLSFLGFGLTYAVINLNTKQSIRDSYPYLIKIGYGNYVEYCYTTNYRFSNDVLYFTEARTGRRYEVHNKTVSIINQRNENR
jgi:hypothetical protein